MTTHHVYYLWDDDDWLLYVGCSGDVDQRVDSHRRTQLWRARIHHVTTSEAMTRDDALRHETDEIRRLAPAFNIRDNYFRHLFDEEWWDGLASERQDGMFYPCLGEHIEEYARRHPRPVHRVDDLDAWLASMQQVAA